MQEEQITSGADNSVAANVTHAYYEIGTDLLSKPNALCDVLESLCPKRAIVFCNNPSDTDFVELLLKKRGLGAAKLIGNVPPARLERVMQQLEEGSISVLVVTDVAARSLKVAHFDLLLNYSVHSDPEIYLERAGDNSKGAIDRQVVSLVSPLDQTHFQYIVKIMEFAIEKRELPQQSDLQAARLQRLATIAKDRGLESDDRLQTLAKQVIERKDKLAIITLLLHNTMDVIPSLQANIERQQDYSEDEDEGPNFNRADANQSRGGDRRGGRNNRGRDDRGREGRGGGDSGNRGGRGGRDGGYRSAGGDRDDYRGGDRGRGDRHRGGDRNRDGNGGGRRRDDGDGDEGSRGRGRQGPPPIRDQRFYIGHGSRDGFSEAQFNQIVKEHCQLESEQVKRFHMRPAYSFVDVSSEVAESFLESVRGAELDGGKSFFIRKATTITTARPQTQSDEDEGATPRNFEDTEQSGQFGSDDEEVAQA